MTTASNDQAVAAQKQDTGDKTVKKPVKKQDTGDKTVKKPVKKNMVKVEALKVGEFFIHEGERFKMGWDHTKTGLHVIRMKTATIDKGEGPVEHEYGISQEILPKGTPVEKTK